MTIVQSSMLWNAEPACQCQSDFITVQASCLGLESSGPLFTRHRMQYNSTDISLRKKKKAACHLKYGGESQSLNVVKSTQLVG